MKKIKKIQISEEHQTIMKEMVDKEIIVLARKINEIIDRLNEE